MDKLSLPSSSRHQLAAEQKFSDELLKDSLFYPKVFINYFVSEASTLLTKIQRRREVFSNRWYRGIQGNTNGRIKPTSQRRKVLAISEKIMSDVLEGLHNFENEKGYLSMEVSLNSLSKKLETNSSYLSKIINHCKGKPFKKYINDLRIAEAYSELKNDSIKRKFTIQAIAMEFGFKSAESFSKKFNAVYGMYPSKYLKELRKSN